jgi:hypothetical protein
MRRLLLFLGLWLLPALCYAQVPAGVGLSGSPPVVMVATITLTPAQITQLNTTPVMVVPAVPGATIVLLEGYAILTYNSTTYTAPTATLTLVFGNSLTTAASASSTTFLTSTASMGTGFRGLNGVNYSPLPIGQPLMVMVGGSNPSVGNSPISLTVWYTLANF